MPRPDAPIRLRPGDKMPPMPQLDPENGFDSVRRTVSYETDGELTTHIPYSVRLLRDLAALRAQAEADPDGALDVGELLRIVELIVQRVF
jgi:hypothetical protein